MNKAIDLSHIYSLRNNFTIIGLTGQIGSGCSEVAKQLEKGFGDGADFEDPFVIGFNEEENGFRHNSYRKYRIIHNFAKSNFKSYSRINYKDVLMFFLVLDSFENLVSFLKSSDLQNELLKLEIKESFETEILELSKIKTEFDRISQECQQIDIKNIKINGHWGQLHNFYFKSDFVSFCAKIHDLLKTKSRIKRNKLLQVISTNLRKSGNPYDFSESPDKIFTIVELINDIIKSHRKGVEQDLEPRTQIVVDDLRNPIEIMFFKQRFAAFYILAVNRDEDSRKKALSEKYMTPDTKEIREAFWKEEYKGGEDDEFFKANISACIQQADIHITFLTKDEAAKKNLSVATKEKLTASILDKTSPYLSWEIQLLKFVSLICQPGLITPSPEERCMQMAFTAKHNSGCISRHVGAAITDENYSIKAIGWNNTPAGQVPCVLRNTEDIMYFKKDVKAFTSYEKHNPVFRNALNKNFEGQIQEHGKNLKGRNVCFCFKDIKNSSSDGKNQVHTRSLHAEESAFLQISKYGGVGIQNGKLFTTASPCELCAKKAYQLGIKVIYYIDPYPGISFEHILLTGDHKIDIRLFNGAIGNAYHWLYDPIMPYKNELTLLLGNKIDNYVEKLEKEIEVLKDKIKNQ